MALLLDQLTVDNAEHRDTLLQRHLRPTPRILQGQALRGLATSAIDISDGLISDLKHVLTASGCGARIDLDALPLSEALLGSVRGRSGAEMGADRRRRL
ncbi:Thiamine-monophosphate kinase [Ewingella americana]|uniref:Thiamine-monophosphate kinase n=1 Tax=Ewingella americana TaxID=41202 RepID=A0A377N8S7_9GAMM|nr:Thiamine-monophosphate kinase [Ewingella americana]